MKKLVYFLILPLSYFSVNAQTTAEITEENTLTEIQNIDRKMLNYQDDDLPWHGRRFKVTAGAFFPVNNTEIEVNGTNGNIGTDIDFEKDLGFQNNTVSFSELLNGVLHADHVLIWNIFI